MRRRGRMVVWAGSKRLAERTKALGLAWAAMEMVAHGAELADVRRMVDAVEREEIR